ncbi:hypothetical protein BBOV_II001580 [Babesia bovis T2Bo]|uniref:hypothetical protein n=1 Tax=Babesia bovis T2Bo TaxID=484906 RepID=UPI001C35C853|nr:hypothetical protein BBOV_II001580 [Babesia bovis T2Bo]EDO06115.2 hypothetical protein BBOV_II001580 [Babesia bovis T2Bo]
MHFLKGFVDGILAEGADSDNAPEGTYDSVETRDGNTSIRDDPHSRALNDIYRETRRECVASLELRYGEGCVEQLNAVLKTNHETVERLAQQLDETYQSLTDFNRELEQLAHQNLSLRKSNAALTNQVELLTSENSSLRSVVTNAELETKSQESRIAALCGLLEDNAATFNVMKTRCAEVSERAAEIRSLKDQLKIANAQIELIAEERNSLITGNIPIEQRLRDAMSRQDRAIAIARMLAREVVHLRSVSANKASKSPHEIDYCAYLDLQRQVAELQVTIERLSDENAHLKEINGKIHNMYADLSKSSMSLKEDYLMEAIQSMSRMHQKQLTPLQLIFVQPTRVLDFELDMEFIRSSAIKCGYNPNVTQVAEHVETESAYGKEPTSREHDINPNTAVISDSSLTEQCNMNKTSGQPVKEPITAPERLNTAKQVWDDDLDIYDEILANEPWPPSARVSEPANEPEDILSVTTEQVQTKVTAQRSFAADVKVDLEKTKQAWNDDLDELLNEQ